MQHNVAAALGVKGHKNDQEMGIVPESGSSSQRQAAGPQRDLMMRLESLNEPTAGGSESKRQVNEAANSLTADLKSGRGAFWQPAADAEATMNAGEQGGDSSGPRNYTESRWFGVVIAGAIFANAIQMGIETDHPDLGIYVFLENFFTATFTWEMFSKQYFERCRYFKNGWNCLDFFLVWMSILDCWIMGLLIPALTSSDDGKDSDMSKLSSLRILRVLRVVRMVRLLKVFKELWLIVKGMLDSVKTIFWASLLLLMLLYVCGILCTQMIGKNENVRYFRRIEHEELEYIDYHPDFDAYQYFGTVPRAMFTLFETSLEPLNIRPVVEKQPFMLTFFLFFIFLTTFGVMNVIVGVIVDNTMEASKETEAELGAIEVMMKIEKVERIRDACFLFDEDGNGFITREEVRQGMRIPAIAECLKELQLPIGSTADEFFDLMDTGGEGIVNHSKMIKSLFRCIAQDDKRHLLDLKIELHQFQRFARESVAGLEKGIRDAEDDLGAKMDQLLNLLGKEAAVLQVEAESKRRDGPLDEPNLLRDGGDYAKQVVAGGNDSVCGGKSLASSRRGQIFHSWSKVEDDQGGARLRIPAEGFHHIGSSSADPGSGTTDAETAAAGDVADQFIRGGKDAQLRSKLANPERGATPPVVNSMLNIGSSASPAESTCEEQRGSMPAAKSSRSRSRRCQFYEAGRCKLGADCPLVHSDSPRE